MPLPIATAPAGTPETETDQIPLKAGSSKQGKSRRPSARFVRGPLLRDDHVRMPRADVLDAEWLGGGPHLVTLLARESNTQILAEFDLSTIERYFPEYPGEIARAK